VPTISRAREFETIFAGDAMVRAGKGIIKAAKITITE
jgi:hypothetical protein